MHFVVCVKQVPAVTEVKIDPLTNTLDRSSAPAILNPYDGYALEEAVQLKERFGGLITVIAMGPPSAAEVIKMCIAHGADAGYLLYDRLFAGSDTLATSYILARAIQKVCAGRPFDVILCGKQAVDGDTAQVGPGIARRLGIPPLTYVKRIELIDAAHGKIIVRRRTEEGDCILAAQLPCLLTVEQSDNELRYASLPAMLRAARFQPVIWGAADIQADPAQIGLRGSPTKVAKIYAPPQRDEGELLQGDASGVVSRLLSGLAQRLVNG